MLVDEQITNIYSQVIQACFILIEEPEWGLKTDATETRFTEPSLGGKEH